MYLRTRADDRFDNVWIRDLVDIEVNAEGFAKGDVPKEDDFVCFEVEASKPTMVSGITQKYTWSGTWGKFVDGVKMVKSLEDMWPYGELRPKRWGEDVLEIEEQ
ncbi:hypothetical protein Tco_1458011 [Tanacetum coccineum]